MEKGREEEPRFCKALLSVDALPLPSGAVFPGTCPFLSPAEQEGVGAGLADRFGFRGRRALPARMNKMGLN